MNQEHQPGSPEGMSPGQVDTRSELAKWISGTQAFPAGRESLLERARSEGAPEEVLSIVRSLPDRTYENMQDVASELGLSSD